MNRHPLGHTALEVSHLGYGCTQLTTLPDRKAAVRILEFAFSYGITHFDVARAYGFGRAEGLLGEFLQGKRSRVTVATKFGIQPPTGWAGNRHVINTAKRLLQPFPWLLQRAKNRGSSMGTSGVFTPAAAVASLEQSLRELRTDYVDIFFLHEATPSDAANESLIEALQAQVALGKIRLLGVASGFEKFWGTALPLASAYQVLQFDDNVVVGNLPKLPRTEPRALVVHSVFTRLDWLHAAASRHPAIVNSFSSQMQRNLADRRILGSMILQYALASPADLVLFSTASPERVSGNVNQASAPGDPALLARFADFVAALSECERGASSPPHLETAS
jgi:aryl-alcohol dehydrogenase-like predicted oxidoreductase